MMYALTVKQPWAEAIARHGKTVENRTRRPPAHLVGQRIAIHVSRSRDGDLDGWDFWRDAAQETIGGIHCHIKQPHLRPLLDWARGEGNDIPDAGRIIATARLVGYVHNTGSSGLWHASSDQAMSVLADRSPWLTGPVGWVLADVRVLREPVSDRAYCPECLGRDTPPRHMGTHCPACKGMGWRSKPIRGQVYPFELPAEVEAAVLAAEVL